MDMNAMKGTQSIAFSESPYLVSAGSVAGKKKEKDHLENIFDIASEDDLLERNLGACRRNNAEACV